MLGFEISTQRSSFKERLTPPSYASLLAVPLTLLTGPNLQLICIPYSPLEVPYRRKGCSGCVRVKSCFMIHNEWEIVYKPNHFNSLTFTVGPHGNWLTERLKFRTYFLY